MGLIDPEPFDRIRRTAGSIGSDGRPNAASTSTTRFEDGGFQSVTAEDVETLPEGERHRAEYTLHTAADLRAGDQYDDELGDHVTRVATGTTYEVRSVTDVGDLLPDEKYMLLRLQEA